MIITPPSDDERATIKAQHAHRFPELFYFPKPGDDGKPVRLPVILGNPTGACKMPEGMRSSKAWGRAVSSSFGADDGYDPSSLISECVLWPSPATWAEWCNRWPALPGAVRPVLTRKYGGSITQIDEPGPEEEIPAEVQSALDANPGANWQRFTAKGAAIGLVVKPPGATAWALFTDAMKQQNADRWALSRDMANAVIAYSSMPFAEAIARWPGLAMLVNRVASYLAGLSSEYEEGEL